MKRLDLPVKFVEGLRVTDEATMEVAKMVLVGKVNKEIVSLINSKGAPAVGLCGDDGWLLRAEQLVKRGQDGSHSRSGPGGRGHRGQHRAARPCSRLTTCRWWPRWAPARPARATTSTPTRWRVRSRPRSRPRRSSSSPTCAACMTDLDDESTVISECTSDDLRELIEDGQGLERHDPQDSRPSSRASRAGVGAAHIIDGRIAHSVLLEILTDDAGLGTKIVPGQIAA